MGFSGISKTYVQVNASYTSMPVPPIKTMVSMTEVGNQVRKLAKLAAMLLKVVEFFTDVVSASTVLFHFWSFKIIRMYSTGTATVERKPKQISTMENTTNINPLFPKGMHN